MQESKHEADALNLQLDLAFEPGESMLSKRDLPAEWQRIVAAGAQTPDPHPEFVASLRKVLAGHVLAPPAPKSQSRRIGIVTYSPPLDRSFQTRTGSKRLQAVRMTVAAAIAAMVLAIFLTAPPWNREDQHGIGIPSVRASSTAIAATATATPTMLATFSDAVGGPSGT